MTIDMIEVKTGDVVATFHGPPKAVWDLAWSWYGYSHVCPDSTDPRHEFDEFTPQIRRESE